MTVFVERLCARNLNAPMRILGRTTSRWIAKAFLGAASVRLFDNLYRLTTEYSGKSTAERVVENVIKTAVKVVVLSGSNALQVSSSAHVELIATLRRKFRKVALTVIAFHEVEFAYDAQFIATAISDCCSLLKRIISGHVTEKSTKRIDSMFRFFGDSDFLDAVFSMDGVHRNTMTRIVKDLNVLLENNSL